MVNWYEINKKSRRRHITYETRGLVMREVLIYLSNWMIKFRKEKRWQDSRRIYDTDRFQMFHYRFIHLLFLRLFKQTLQLLFRVKSTEQYFDSFTAP